MGEDGGNGWIVVLGIILACLIAIPLLRTPLGLLLEILFFLFVLFI